MGWPGWGALVTTWRPSWLVDGLVIAAALAYTIGVRPPARRGMRWARARVLAFAVALIGLVVTFDSAVGVYRHPSFAVHMIMHLMLIMVVPALWVASGPVELTRRVGSEPTRELIGSINASPAARASSTPRRRWWRTRWWSS
jgi:putative membrane protein